MDISFLGTEADELDWSVIVKSGNFYNPLPVELQKFLIPNIAYPEVNLSKIFFDLDSYSIEICQYFFLSWDEAKENVFP